MEVSWDIVQLLQHQEGLAERFNLSRLNQPSLPTPVDSVNAGTEMERLSVMVFPKLHADNVSALSSMSTIAASEKRNNGLCHCRSLRAPFGFCLSNFERRNTVRSSHSPATGVAQKRRTTPRSCPLDLSRKNSRKIRCFPC